MALPESTKAYREFGGKVPDADYQEFRRNFTQYGATNWLVNTAVREVNRLVREDGSYKNIVERAIQDFLNERRESKP